MIGEQLSDAEKDIINRSPDKYNPLTLDEISRIAGFRYTYLSEMFYRNNWKIKDLLMYYNNLDTAPFIVALENLVKYYSERNVDIFKEAISVLGIAERLAFKTVKKDFFYIIQWNA